MKGSDRAVVISVLAVALLGVFYFMVISPKREEAAKLGEEVEALEASIDEQEQVATFAEEARKDFPKYYGRMVVLGKAVPQAADTASLLVEVDSISADAGVEFQGLTLAQNGESAAAAAPVPVEPAPPATEGEPAPETTPAAEPSATAVAAPATEAAAANLPIGAAVGPAGLPTLPYDLDFVGDFFQVADFVSGLDDLISIQEDSGQVSVDGRLLTIDGFALQGGLPGSSPDLNASFLMTTFVTPAEQGLTLGASPEGPAVGAEIVPAASVTP